MLQGQPSAHEAGIDCDAERRRRFAQIDAHYQDRYRQLQQRGEAPYRNTRLGAWAASIGANTFEFFSRIQLDNARLCIDLGSGDGIVVCIAGLFTRAVGIEIDPAFCSLARQAVQRLDLNGRVSILCADYRTQRIRAADCLYLYPDKPVAETAALLVGWQGRLVIAGAHFPPDHFVPVQRLDLNRDRLVVYRHG
jgi:hypothetical protein